MMTKIYHSKEYLLEQLENKNYLQIAKENNVDSSTIQRWLRKFKLTRNYNYWSSAELKLLEDNYFKNQNLHRLFPERTLMSIYHKGNKLKFKREMRQRDYSINENFFKKWTPEMAYIFGWFCSDGYVSSTKDCCGLHIHVNDKAILRKIKMIMGSNHPIKNYAEGSRFVIYNKILCHDLINLGCFPRKSAVLPFPNVPDHFLSHFLRGYFDGDGSIYFNKPNTIIVSFIASKSFVETLQHKMNHLLNLRIGKLQKHFKIYICRYYGDDARKICHWMYKDCGDLYLTRKRERFNNHLRKRGEL